MKNGQEAGNTNENLRGVDRDIAVANAAAEGLPSAEDLDAVAMEAEMAAATAKALEQPESEFVSRTEFNQLLERINAFNTRSGHKI